MLRFVLVFLLFLFVVFLVVDYFRFDPLERAESEITFKLIDYDIPHRYFEFPPRFVGESNGYLIYEAPSIEPWKGAVRAMAYIPKERKKKIEVLFEGKDKYFESLRGSSKLTYSQLLLVYLLEYEFFTNIASNWWDYLLDRDYYEPYRDVVFDKKTKENLINFQAIDWALLQAPSTPSSLKELVQSTYPFFIEKEDIFDPYGREYFYKVQGRYVILGSKGENGKWDFDRETLNKVFSNAEEKLFFVKGDDIIVKMEGPRRNKYK
ncbi:hypothetical protein [Thermospira aquatica]|uniref:Uncharacterized protein n=1 Tax=Thermospira aquatica TaxID=2828656 RepID=A0AAX3BE19_9SPIR|nr:hypothetical protein [Thermospira aquatica]URA10587.1 hypothetical protein KDW03_01940 [Thermospira aquatica]